jgi:hypothetical protein
MTPTQMAITLPMATISTLLFVVACANSSGDSARVMVTGHGGAKTRAMAMCANKIPSGMTVIVGKDDETADICAADIDPVTKKPNPNKYVVEKIPVWYKLERAESTVEVKISSSVNFPAALTEENLKTANEILDYCESKLSNAAQTGAAQSPKVMAHVEFAAWQSDKRAADSVGLMQVAENEYALELWPKSPRLFLALNAEQSEACPDDAYKPTCLQTELKHANLPFCMNLAKLAGSWLGLEAPTDQRCTDSTERKSAPRRGYMAAAYQETAEDFFRSAQLLPEDIKAILSPACKGKKPAKPVDSDDETD